MGALGLQAPDGQPLRTVLAQPRRAALLLYLALAKPRGLHRRDTLLALFWPEHDTEHARNALSQALHFLRSTLGQPAVVIGDGDTIGLDWREFWCDAVAFEEALDTGRRPEALDYYRSDLLEGFHISDAAAAFGRWLEAERARLGARYAQALEQEAEERTARGDAVGAVTYWRRLAAHDMYNSRIALGLMRALAAAGDPAGALQHARVHGTLLRDELGVEPDAEVAALVRELQSPRPEPRSSLSAAPSIAPTATHVERPPPAPLRRRRTAIGVGGLVLVAAVVGFAVLRGWQPPPPTIRSLAVLPLENLSGDSTNRIFADGMHDALITELARYPDLIVISRTSVMRYRGEDKKALSEIARELNVDGIVEGTLLWEGGRVRMNVQLVHGPSDRHLWAETYSRDLRDVLVLQQQLAEAIAREVRAATAPVERHRVVASGPADSAPQVLHLQELLLRGRLAEISRSPTGLAAAKEAYRRTIERDSMFAAGYAGLAGVYSMLAEYDYAPARRALDSARLMARRAMTLDSTLPDARTALGMLLGTDREFQAAEQEFRRAIQLAPSNARAHYWYSVLLVALGRGEEALAEANRAAALDPFAPRGVTAMQRSAEWLITGEHPEMQVPVAQRPLPILTIEPGEPVALAWEALDLAEQGNCADALPLIQRAQQFVTGNSLRLLQYVGAVDWWCGRRERARALNERMKRLPSASEHGARIAMMYVLFGELDSAFVWLPRTQWTLGWFSGLSADRRWDAVRSDPRFARFIKDLGLRP
jgi:TolB-like protein/DNA-binding SARP family transcriptional activator/Tfp pilus assembly protein PilF